MRRVKKQMAAQLFVALAEANNGGIGSNDLEPRHSSQGNLYGHLAESIKSLGYEGEYWHWIETSEIPTNFDMTEAIILTVLNSDMFDNDVHSKIEYIMSRNSSYSERELLAMYDK